MPEFTFLKLIERFLLSIVFNIILLSSFVQLISVLIMNKYGVCRYLVTGNSFISLHYEYLLDATTVREIARDTCDAIWECLKPAYMSATDKYDWIRTADEFYEDKFSELHRSC